MKQIKMLMTWGELCGDSIYQVDDATADQLVREGRAVLHGEIAPPVETAALDGAPETAVGKRQRK